MSPNTRGPNATYIPHVEGIALRNTRGANRFRFYTERYNVVKYKNSLYYKGAALWDALPSSIVECDTLFEFKVALKKEMGPYAIL